MKLRKKLIALSALTLSLIMVVPVFADNPIGWQKKQDGGTEQMPQEQPGITMAGSGLMETRMEFQSATISLRTDTS